jgi:hypothetical protein
VRGGNFIIVADHGDGVQACLSFVVGVVQSGLLCSLKEGATQRQANRQTGRRRNVAREEEYYRFHD